MSMTGLGAALVSAGLLLTSSAAFGDEGHIVLADGDGRDLVRANCVMCHSLDYILMNAPVMSRARWESSVKKMIDKMGAPISRTDAQLIVEYLSRHYAAAEK